MANVNAAEIDRILEIAPAKTLEIEGYTYIDKDKRVELFKPPVLATLPVSTLTGFVDLCEADFETFREKATLVHVVSHERVEMLSRVSDQYGRRLSCFAAVLQKPEREFAFNTYHPQETFVIGLRALFVQGLGDDLDTLVAMAGSLAHNLELKQEDDGFTQEAKVKTGVVFTKEKVLKPRVKLTPYRTFREAVQPSSEYVFRVKGGDHGNTCALFEADGGNWKLDAIQNVKTWLKNRLNGSTVEGLGDIPVIA